MELKIFIFRGRKPESDDDASVDFDGEDSASDYDENEKLLLERTRKELAQGPYDSDEESEVINLLHCYHTNKHLIPTSIISVTMELFTFKFISFIRFIKFINL